jgi:hypothetical protein
MECSRRGRLALLLTKWRESGSSSRRERHGSVFTLEDLMKVILTLLGVLFLVAAGFYFVFPADQLPSFLPGHETGVPRVHYKHGAVAAAAGIVLIAAGWWAGRR